MTSLYFNNIIYENMVDCFNIPKMTYEFFIFFEDKTIFTLFINK